MAWPYNYSQDACKNTGGDIITINPHAFPACINYYTVGKRDCTKHLTIRNLCLVLLVLGLILLVLRSYSKNTVRTLLIGSQPLTTGQLTGAESHQSHDVSPDTSQLTGAESHQSHDVPPDTSQLTGAESHQSHDDVLPDSHHVPPDTGQLTKAVSH